MTILITGAGGFVGSALVRRLSAGLDSNDRILATDISFAEQPPLPGVEYLPGSIDDPDHLAALTARPLERVFHLATIAGVQQSDFQLGKRVNLDASLALLDALSRQPKPVRLVYSSSVGVFGGPLPAVVNDDTLPVPPWTYGTHKLVCELLITDYARVGLVDGIALRFPGIMARPQGSTTMLSAFLSNVFYAAHDGREFSLPMAPEDVTWLMSRRKVIDNMIRASTIPTEALPERRAWTLPALVVTMRELVDALGETFGPAASHIGYAPDPAARGLFALPGLEAPGAEALGLESDGTAVKLVQNVVSENPALQD